MFRVDYIPDLNVTCFNGSKSPTSKKRKKQTEREGSAESESKEGFSDNYVDASRSKKSQVAIGHHITQKIETPKKPIEVLPQEGNERLFVDIGRWIMRTFFKGDMVHSLKPFGLVVGVIAVITGYLSIGRVYLDPTSIASSTFNAYLEMAYVLVFAISVSVGGGIIGIAGRTTCPKCGQKFMFTRKKRLITGQGTHRGYEVTNYKSDWSCDNCGHKEKVPEVVERAIPED